MARRVFVASAQPRVVWEAQALAGGFDGVGRRSQDLALALHGPPHRSLRRVGSGRIARVRLG